MRTRVTSRAWFGPKKTLWVLGAGGGHGEPLSVLLAAAESVHIQFAPSNFRSKDHL
jgi:hypothetical protein